MNRVTSSTSFNPSGWADENRRRKRMSDEEEEGERRREREGREREFKESHFSHLL